MVLRFLEFDMEIRGRLDLLVDVLVVSFEVLVESSEALFEFQRDSFVCFRLRSNAV